MDIFFVISGFIIMTIADRPMPGARTGIAAKFLVRRALRIYPLFWITLLAMLAMLAWTGNAGPAVHRLHKWQVWALLRTQIPLQNPAWSLVFEVWFYACTFALLLLPQRSFRRALAVWVCAQAVAVCWHLGTAGWPGNAVLGRPQVLEFFLGSGVCVLTRWRVAGAWLVAACCGVAAIVFGAGCWRCYEALPTGSLFDTERLLFYGVPAALALAALVSLEQRDRIRVPGWLLHLGDCSYSIYLWHFPVMSAAFLAFSLGKAGVWPSLPRAMLEFAATLVVAGWSYRFIEQPTIQLGHRLTGGGVRRDVAA